MNPSFLPLTARSRPGLLLALVLGFGVAGPFESQAAAQPENLEPVEKETVTDAAPEEDKTLWEVSAGGVLNTGNTESFQISAGSRFELVRGMHSFQADFTANYGEAVVDQETDEFEKTSENLIGRTRYDFFLTPMDAIFAAAIARRNTFAGLDARLQGQVGYLRNIFKDSHPTEDEGVTRDHRLWVEGGYDITYDNFDPDPLLDEMGNVLDGDQVVHAARGFVGYDNQLNEAVTLRTGVEGLLNVEDPEDFRLNWDNTLRSSLADNLKLELRFLLQLDTEPVPGATEVDTVTLINLIYTLI